LPIAIAMPPYPWSPMPRIADESVAEDAEKLVAFLTEKGHPALTMDPMF